MYNKTGQIMSDSKLSILAQYDDLCRNTAVLTTGIESEFSTFVNLQESCRKKWLSLMDEFAVLGNKFKISEDENVTLQTQLKHARVQVDREMKKRQKCEQERDSLERQIMFVREHLNKKNNADILKETDMEKLAFLSPSYQPSHIETSPKRNLHRENESASLLSPSDIDYDETNEELDFSVTRSGLPYRRPKRPSAPPLQELDVTPPEKKSRRNKQHMRANTSLTATTTVTVKDTGIIDATSEISAPQRDKRRRRSKSAPGKKIQRYSSQNKDSPNYGFMIDSQSPNYRPQADTPPHDTMSPGMRHYNSAGSRLNRPHNFVSKTIIKPETCSACKKRISFGKTALKCRDCRSACHPECRDLMPIPCTPILSTPGSAKLSSAYLSEYAPKDPPMIPALIVHCVNEVESRGLNEVGIYRASGSEREVKELKEKFLRGKTTPNLSHVYDIHVVCGCLKDFLRSLKEPLLTHALWQDFVNAAENPDKDEGSTAVYQAISELPQANRDTVAFIILHLQRVSECSECKMPVSNLAKVFGPTIFGYSTPDPEPMQMINETRLQQLVMEKLIGITSDYWSMFLNIEDELHLHEDTATPYTSSKRQVLHSMLGPLSTPGENDEPEDKKLKFTPKFGSKHRHFSKNPTHFFSSPSLK